MKLIETIIEELQSLLKEKGEDLSNYKFYPISSSKIKISKSDVDYIIDLHKEINRLIELSDHTTDTLNITNKTMSDDLMTSSTELTQESGEDTTDTEYATSETMHSYNLDECIQNCLSLIESQIDKNSNGLDFDLDNDFYILGQSVSNPTSLDALHFEEQAIVSTSGHNLTLYKIKSGNPGFNIVVVPGYLSSHVIYTNILTDQTLLDRHNIYIFDPRGQGGSDAPNPEEGLYGSKMQNADDIKSVIDALDINNIVLIGHSLGWLRIGDYIDRYGQYNIKGLVCIDGFPEAGTEKITRLIDGTYLTYLMTFLNRTSLYHTDIINEFVNIINYSFMNDPGSEFKTLFATDTWSVRSDLRLPILAHEPVKYLDNLWSTITIPTLIQWGEYDNVLNIQTAKEIYKIMPRSILKLYNAKHYPFIDDHAKFMNDLNRFLDTLG